MRAGRIDGPAYVWEFRVSLVRMLLLAAVPVLTLYGCTAATDGGSERGVSAESPPDSGGLGVKAAGGLLAAKDRGNLPPAAPVRIAGRLLDGPYLLFLGPDDVARARRAAQNAFETTPAGQTSIWRNPANGHWGTVTPARTFRDAAGRYCRDYRQTVTVDGQEHQGNGTACREPNGAWRIMS